MADAVLSDGSELLLSNAAASDNTPENTQYSVTDQRSLTSNNCDHAHQLEQAQPTSVECDDPKHDIASVVVIRREHPTSVATQKYQRRSYDDRQLPPVVCIDREIPWYHNSVSPSSAPALANNNSHITAKCNEVPENNNVMLSPSSSIKSLSSSSSSVTPVRKKIHQPNVVAATSVDQPRRFSKKASQTVRSAKMTSSVVIVNEGYAKEHINAHIDSDKKYESTFAYVAAKEKSPIAGNSELNGFTESVSNNNKYLKNSGIEHITSSGADSACAASSQRKLSSIKKRVNRRDSSGECNT